MVIWAIYLFQHVYVANFFHYLSKDDFNVSKNNFFSAAIRILNQIINNTKAFEFHNSSTSF